MPRTQNTRLMAAMLLLGAACTNLSPTEAPALAGGVASASKGIKAIVCHASTSGEYNPLSLPESGRAAHIAHGDPAPGANVTGQPGYRFDDRCVPVLARINLTGRWTGTYSWNCGGPVTVSTPIQFVLTENAVGRVAGTVAYLGGVSDLSDFENFRLSNPTYAPDGRLYSGTMDPDGVMVRLTTNTGSEGHFVNNQFDGTITDPDTITGRTLNGESAGGCSAATGYAGSFVIMRQP